MDNPFETEEQGGVLEFTEGGPHVEVDADYLAYSIGSVCEYTVYDIWRKNRCVEKDIKGKTELYKKLNCANKKEFEEKMLSPRWINQKVKVKERKHLDKVENCLYSVKASVKKLVEDLGAGSIRLWLTVGSVNFRNEVATMNKYKS